jgi:hypothetical protein
MGFAGLLPMLRPITQQMTFRQAASHVRTKFGLENTECLKVVVDGCCCWIHAAAERYGKAMLAGDYAG